MNKKLIPVMLSFVIMSTFSIPALATQADQPMCSGKIIRYFDYNGFHVKEHKWYCTYNSDSYTIKFYSENDKLLGWQIFENGQIISKRDFTLTISAQLPLCGGEMNIYFDYKDRSVKEHRWDCTYGSDVYKIKVYSENSLLLGWQIFQNSRIVSSRSFL
jgi:hypothetical protein